MPMRARRKSRIARNQSLFRGFNEAVMVWPDRQAAPATDKFSFYCECADPKCFERVWLTGPEYEAVRADSARFVVAPGHVFPSAERVFEEHDGYQIVQKDEDVRHIVEQLDPRKVAHA